MSETIQFDGQPVRVNGPLPAAGTQAPDFTLTGAGLGDLSLQDFAGRRKVLSIFPSVDTGVCGASVRAFNRLVSGDDTVVLCISADLPFAQARFCGAEGLDNVVMLSGLRGGADFMRDYGVAIDGGLLGGLMTRAVVVLDRDNTVLKSEYVHEITQEPDYAAVLEVLK